VEKLVKTGVINALVAFGKSDSENSNELLSRYMKLLALIQLTLQYRYTLISKTLVGGNALLRPRAL